MRTDTVLLKRLAAMIICAALILPCAPLASAQTEISYQGHAEALAPLGVFIGTGNDFELGRAPTRIEGLVVLIRLLGADHEAKDMMDMQIPFTDVAAWATGYAAYAYERGLTQGISATQFGSSNTLDAKMFCTFLLRALGYSDKDGDFEYASAVEFAYSIELVQQKQMDEIASGLFLRDQMAKLSYDALSVTCKDDSSGSLLDTLVAAGSIDPAKAEDFIATRDALSGSKPAPSADKTLTELAEQAISVVKLDCKYGTGSGVILSEDGTIVTNYHVIQGEPWVRVLFDDGAVYEGDVYVQDYSAELDLAIIKINKTGLVPVTLGDSSVLKRGDRVVAIGSPLGYLNTLSEGIVSGFATTLDVDAIQITAAISPGSSGGALLDMKGRLVGITFASEVDGQNLGFAIPSNNIAKLTAKKMLTLEQFLNEIITPYKPAAAVIGYPDASSVPDFGVMYGVEPSESADEDGFSLYFYEGVTLEHVDDYEHWLEKWGFEYNGVLSAILASQGIFSDPAAFLHESTDKIVVVDVYFFGDVVSVVVAFEQ